MKEWKDPYNSFNSWKGLLFSKWYEAIEEWRTGRRIQPLPPIEASLDPIHACNLLCEHCNAHRYLTNSKENTTYRMSDAHILNLVKFLSNWGVKAICFGGGGEPTLHTKLGEALILSKSLGMENSIATNGTLFEENLIQIMSETCRWVGVSIDASNHKTYSVGRKKDLFNQAIFNLGALVSYVKKHNSTCDVAFKFLIFDYNQNEIYEACKIAKKIGVKDFHARPADFRHQGLGEWKKKSNLYNIKLIEKQFEACHKLATDSFRVFTVVHKFNDDFTPKRKFSQCWASPICIQLCASGDVFLCPDTRHTEYFKLGTHYPNPEEILKIWGSEYHYSLTFHSGCNKCTSRCTFSPYNEQCERLFIHKDDPMCWKFV